jgi:membrane peptidoglycan carboxypeptidase
MKRSLNRLSVAFTIFALLITPALQTTVSAKARHARTRRVAAKSLHKRTAALNKRHRFSTRRSAAARRRAEAARRAAIARQRALDEALRARVQMMIAGDELTGEDKEVRQVAINALGGHAGTVVVMDPQTGRVYSIVNQEWALREGFKPCSTIKLVTGLAGLNENIINPADTANISDRNTIDLTRALAYSKNGYFQQVGGLLGFDKIIDYARALGLGEKTGINSRNEFSGSIPATKSGFALNHMSSHGDDFKVTAVQLSTLISAMANGGKLVTPIIARTRQDELELKPRVRRQLDIDPTMWRYMVPGMVGAVNYGSGRRAYDPTQTVAGKTGTCIEPDGTWVGLFTSFAPLPNPKLAVVVITRGSDARSHFPAAVAGQIYRELNGRFGIPGNIHLTIARADENLASENTADEEENEEEADELNGSAAIPDLGSKERPNGERKPWWGDSKVKRVLMPIPKRKN